MGKKYIVEIGRLERLYKAYTNGNGKPNLTWLSPEVDLTPYTEPDLERVKKTAHDDGYSEGYQAGREDVETQFCSYDACKNRQEEYLRGLTDAWEAARKIGNMPYGEEEKAFGSGGWAFVEKHTASEAIEKLKAYEQEQEYHVGNEFENEAGQKFIVLKMNGKEIDRYMDGDGSTYHMNVKYKVMRKTGRHFPEIAAVLENMRGEQNG